MATETGQLWKPPNGMGPKVVADWRAFYAKALQLYGITPQDYRDMYRAQHGVCYICRVAKGKNPDDPRGRGGRRLGVDHNHAMGNGNRAAVRGLLCTGGDRTCNRIIGWLDVHQLRRAVDYLEHPPAQKVFDSTQGMDWWERQNGRGYPDRDAYLAGRLGLKTVNHAGH
jgi:hypothetical protein